MVTRVDCPAKASCRRACASDYKIELEPEIYDDDEGGHRVGYCYQCHPAEPFSIPLDAIPGVANASPVTPEKSEEGMDGLVKAFIKKSVVEPIQRSLRDIKKEVRQVHGNTDRILDNQGDEERLTDHDNEAYHPRYEGIQLDMLEEACALVDSGKMNRSQAAVHVFRRHSYERHGFSSERVFKSTFYRYYKKKSLRT